MNYGLEDVCLRRGDTQVLTHYTLRLPSQGVLCLLGPSGCGKTTVLHLLCGLLTPDSGRVYAPAQGRLGVVFQEDRLLPWLSVLDNAALPPACIGRERALDLLGELELGERAGQLAATLSGGQRRRVVLTRALAMHSELLLLDEPFKGLDPALREKACAMVAQAARQVPCLLVTHDAEDARLTGAQVVHFGKA